MLKHMFMAMYCSTVIRELSKCDFHTIIQLCIMDFQPGSYFDFLSIVSTLSSTKMEEEDVCAVTFKNSFPRQITNKSSFLCLQFSLVKVNNIHYYNN